MALQDAQTPKKEMILAPKYKVFLSHSGFQKGFVEQLDLDLQQGNRHAFFDKNLECLPIADNFPQRIIDAIHQCEVCVVLLTAGFLSSKWPMVELVEMVRTMEGNNRMKIMPIFYGVSVEDLKDETKLSSWKAKWQEFLESDERKHGNKRKRIDISEWEAALTKLNPIHGIIHNSMITEVQLRKKIVDAICKLVRPLLEWDDSFVQGKLRFIKIFEEKVKEMPSSTSHNFQVVGFHGVGGIGKTTFCKYLCKHFEEGFCGRVCHVELGKRTTFETLRMVLKKLGNRTSEHLKDLSEDECGEDLKNIIHCGKVFLAIDNISSDSKVIEEVRRYLDTQFAGGSIVVLTTHACALLTIIGINAKACLRMPELMECEATSLFLSHAKCEDVDEEIVMQCIRRCYFNRGDEEYEYHYLPLVLEVLGKHLRGSDPSTWVKNLELNPLRNTKHPVFQTLGISFDVLLRDDKDMFMDVAIFHVESYYDLRFRSSHWNVYEWLRVLHGLRDIDEVKKRLYILKTKSLLEEVDDCEKIGMHDLWKEFASYKIKVGEEGRRWVGDFHLFNEVKESVLRYGGWKELERISIISSKHSSTMKLSLKSCSNLKALRLYSVNFQEGMADLVGLSHLQIMEIYDSNIQISSGMRQFKNLQVLIWREIGMESGFFLEEVGLLTNLEILQLEFHFEYCEDDDEVSTAPSTMMSVLDLRDLTSLHEARITHGRFSMLSLSSTLRVLNISECDELVNCPDLQDVIGLEVLKLVSCLNLETLPNLQKLKNLKVLNISESGLLTQVSGLENMVSLRKLKAWGCYKLQALSNMSKLTNLKRLDVGRCDMLDSIPGISSLTALEKLGVTIKCLNDTPNIRELVNLDEVCIYGQKGVSDECLQALDFEIFENVFARLTLWYITCELKHLHKLTRLKTLEIVWCDFKRLPTSLIASKPLTTLKSIFLARCKNLKELPSTSYMPGLRKFTLSECGVTLNRDECEELLVGCKFDF